MEWITENWIWILLIGGFLAWHTFGGGCCGRGAREDDDENDDKEASAGGGRKGGVERPPAYRDDRQGPKQHIQSGDGGNATDAAGRQRAATRQG